jgi:hypothetical protein
VRGSGAVTGGKAKLTVVSEAAGQAARNVIDIRGLSLIFQTGDTPVFTARWKSASWTSGS